VSSREEIGAILSHDDEDYVSVVYKNCAGFIRVCKKYFPPDHHALIGVYISSSALKVAHQ